MNLFLSLPFISINTEQEYIELLQYNTYISHSHSSVKATVVFTALSEYVLDVAVTLAVAAVENFSRNRDNNTYTLV